MSTDENKATIRHWVEEAWNRGNVEIAADLYKPAYVIHDLPPEVGNDLEGLKRFITLFRTACPDFHMRIDDMVAEGDKVAWRITCTATHRGELLGIPATGRHVEVSGIVVSRFEDGTWAEDFVIWDQLTMLQQLGVIPAPQTVGA